MAHMKGVTLLSRQLGHEFTKDVDNHGTVYRLGLLKVAHAAVPCCQHIFLVTLHSNLPRSVLMVFASIVYCSPASSGVELYALLCNAQCMLIMCSNFLT